MPVADVRSHQALTSRPVIFRRSKRTRLVEDYSEFLICIVVILRSERCEVEGITSLCL